MSFTKEGQDYANSLLNPFKFKMGMLMKLPSIYFWGIRVQSLDHASCSVSIPFKWSTKNPFKSIYFAAQSGAAELSTGLLLDSLLKGRGRWSMLVIASESKFTKKATNRVIYRCNDGLKMLQAIQKAEATKEPQIIDTETIGMMENGMQVGWLKIQWSIKKKG